jgi:hypothetical protein
MGSLQRPDLPNPGLANPGASLEDRWNAAGEPVVMTGIQALVRLPLLRRQLDDALGWNTAGFVSGYRGSPLGGYDKELEKQHARLAAAKVVFTPGLNEDLAATAVWGTQQVGLSPGARHEGRVRHLVRQGAGHRPQRRRAAPRQFRRHHAEGWRAGAVGRRPGGQVLHRDVGLRADLPGPRDAGARPRRGRRGAGIRREGPGAVALMPASGPG